MTTTIDPAYWRDVIRRGEATFFVGAGVSALPPARLPLATGLVASLIDPVLQPLALPKGLARSIARALVRLRPEVITDVLLEHLGVDAARPLAEHAARCLPNAVARLSRRRSRRGMLRHHDELRHAHRKAARLPSELTHRHRRRHGHRRGSHAERSILFKIHGSIGGNIRDGASSPPRLRCARFGLGRRPLRRPSLLPALFLESRPLVVLGYSGRDDFDILPALLNPPANRGRPLDRSRTVTRPLRPLAGPARRSFLKR